MKGFFLHPIAMPELRGQILRHDPYDLQVKDGAGRSESGHAKARTAKNANASGKSREADGR
jgi:hypothetical protein